MPEIVVKYEDKVIERVVSEKKRISIGRTSDNDIVLAVFLVNMPRSNLMAKRL